MTTKTARIKSNGYYVVFMPEHPNAFGREYVYEHRLVIEKQIGRYLLKEEIVHHIDGNKLNNEPTNLRLEPSIAHHKVEHRLSGSKRRMPDEENPLIECPCGCGEKFRKYDESGRLRVYFSGGHHQRAMANVRRAVVIPCKCGCGAKIHKYDQYGRVREYISGHNGKSVNSKTEISRRSGLSFQTILLYYKGDKLRKSTIKKIERAIIHE